jgi:DNA (cytosine-5)-methyltransferase 1
MDLFAGAGGLSLGLHKAGFHHLALVEYERKACDTLKRNAQRWEERGADVPPWRFDQVHEVDARDFLKGTHLPSDQLTLLAGRVVRQPGA